jgi:hypothetical protein
MVSLPVFDNPEQAKMRVFLLFSEGFFASLILPDRGSFCSRGPFCSFPFDSIDITTFNEILFQNILK